MRRVAIGEADIMFFVSDPYYLVSIIGLNDAVSG